jgi:hypothetical protein
MHLSRNATSGPSRRRRAVSALLGVGIGALLVTGGFDFDPSDASSAAASPSDALPTDGKPNPTAPKSDRVDLETPSFSNPTKVDNPLFPIGDLHSAILLGNDEGRALRIETTLLPGTKTIEWKGKKVKTLVSQFVSYLDGRIHEVALDWYAQADDGAVWYFGENVFNFQDGKVADTHGSWRAGEDGPPGMIMPARPQVGAVYRTENIPGKVFEEVTVKAAGQTVPGPRGPVADAIVGQENHLIEGNYEDKTFAPGYGEFRSGVGGNLEALAVAVPTDALPTGVPAEIATISRGANDIFDAAAAGNWDAAASTLDSMKTAWATHRASGTVPPLLDTQMSLALDALTGNPLVPAVQARNDEGARTAAVDVGLASRDLELQYRPVSEIDLARFDLWSRRLLGDSGSAEADPGHIAGDVAALTRVWDRIAHTVDPSAARAIKAELGRLQKAAKQEDVASAAERAKRLSQEVAGLQPAA